MDDVTGHTLRMSSAVLHGDRSRQPGGGTDLMIDSTRPSSRQTPSSGPGSDEGEEARLRQQAIGVKLRHMFDEVVNEPVPDEFLDILRRADAASSNEGKD